MLNLVSNKKTGLWLTTSLVVIGALFYAMSFFLLQDQFLTIQFRNSLQKKLSKNGLKIEIGNIHWSGWGSFKCSKVSLADIEKDSTLVQAEELDLSFNLLSLIASGRHPERALREVELFKPSLRLKRYSDGTWELQKYFTKTGRKLRLDTVFKVKNGMVSLDDELYGKLTLTQINGKARFIKGESFTWECDGSSDFNQDFQWSSRGGATINFKTGHGEISVANLLLKKIAPYLPEPYTVEVFKGTGKIDLEFSWDNGRFSLQKGMAVLKDTQLKIPALKEMVDIKELDGEISPAGFSVKKARLAYNGSLINLSGRLITETAAIKGSLSGEKIDLADLTLLIPGLKPYQIKGLADVRVAFSGTVERPIFNGELVLNGVGVNINQDLKVKGVSGRARIDRNDLEIEQMKGFLGEASLGVTGKIINIFAPRFGLELFGTGLNPAELGLPELAGLKIGPAIDFKGKVSGELWSPMISGELQIDRVEYQDLPAENVKAAITWDVASKTVQISKLAGEIGEGSFLAEGAVIVNPKGVEWKVSGELTELELGSTEFGAGLGINGRISTHALLKGNWQLGEPFDLGLILGTFKGDGFTNQEIQLRDIQGVYSWEKNKLSIDSIHANTGKGRIYGHLTWDTRILTASFNAEQIGIRELLPDDKKYPFDGIIDGFFEFKGPLPDIQGKIQGTIRQATYLTKPLGEITGSFEYADQGIKIVSLQVASDTGDYYISGGVNWLTEPAVNITVSSDNINLKGFGNWLPINASSSELEGFGTLRLDLSGPITNPFFTGEIQLDAPRWGEFRMEQGTVQLEGDFQEIWLNRIELNDGLSSLVLSGRASREDLALFLAGSQINLAQLGLEYDGKKLQGRLDFEGKLVGNPSDPILTVEIRPGSLAFGPFIGDIRSGALTLKGQEIQLSQVKLGGEDFKLNINGKIDIAQPYTVDLGIDVTDLNFAKLLQFFNVSGVDTTGKLGGLVKITGNPFRPEIRFNGELADATVSSVPVHGEFKLDYHQQRLNIEHLKLWQGSGNLFAEGSWEAGSAFNLQVKTAGFPLETLNSLLPSGHQLAGTIDLDTNLAWSKSEVAGELTAKLNGFYLNQNQLGNLQLRGRITEQGLSIDESILQTKEGSITAQGNLPWPDQVLSKMGVLNVPSQGLHLKLVFKDTPVGMVNSYLPDNIKVTSGSLNGQLLLEGAYGWPLFSGKLRADHVEVDTHLLPLPIKKARVAMNINHNKIFIPRGRGEYGDGKFTIDGEIVLFGEEDQLHYNLNLKGSKLYYKNNYFDGFANLDLQLTGTTNDSMLSGDINIFESRIGILKMGKKEASKVKWNPKFDLQVTTGKNVRYRQVGLADISVRSSLRVGGDLKKPLLSGEAISNKGVLTLYGQTFKVNRGKAVFKYSEGFYPYIDIESSVLTPKAEVFLNVKGQIGEDLVINLYSYPSLSEEELFAMLNWSELRGDKPLSVQEVANTNLNIVVDTMFGEVFYELRQALHLDYLYLEHDYTEDEFRINAGDYVSSRLFLSYSRSVSDESKEKWGLDYHLTPNLTAGGTYSIEEGTSWRLTYRFRF